MTLPGDTWTERFATQAIPGQHRFALVGDCQSDHLGGGNAIQHLPGNCQGSLPDLPGILLNPGGLGICDGDRPGYLFHKSARLIHQEGFRVGGAFVRGEDEFLVGVYHVYGRLLLDFYLG